VHSRSSSRYRNLHTIRTDSAATRRETEEGIPPRLPSRRISHSTIRVGGFRRFPVNGDDRSLNLPSHAPRVLGHYRELLNVSERERQGRTEGQREGDSLRRVAFRDLSGIRKNAEKQDTSAGMSVTPRDAVPFLRRVRGHFEICPRRARLLTKGCARSLPGDGSCRHAADVKNVKRRDTDSRRADFCVRSPRGFIVPRACEERATIEGSISRMRDADMTATVSQSRSLLFPRSRGSPGVRAARPPPARSNQAMSSSPGPKGRGRTAGEQRRAALMHYSFAGRTPKATCPGLDFDEFNLAFAQGSGARRAGLTSRSGFHLESRTVRNADSAAPPLSPDPSR